MELKETTLDQTEIYKGKVFTVHVDNVSLPNGHVTKREVVEHHGGVAVLALDENNNVLTVTQYRYVFGRTLLELPAGKLEPGEDPRSCGLRELKEETGAVPETFTSLGTVLPTPGYCTEVLHLYLARGLRFESQHLDPDEFLNAERIPFGELFRMCLEGEVTDAKTVAAVLKAKYLLNL